ncbi:MAG: polyprenyl synthetase family protein [Lachnospiraceae bacterium]|nr:polyprenyl synthetase family protein [Lachnospiraceae bacterium]
MENNTADLTALLRAKAQQAGQIVESFAPEAEGFQKTVIEAMRYSLLSGGKRIRPVLMSETFSFLLKDGCGENAQEAVQGCAEMLKPFMAAIEMIHTYSLIHDDLPALDNDDYRRGRLTSHKVFGEDMAILAGDALLNYAFETAARAFDLAKDEEELRRASRAMKILAEKPGIYGMIGGQTADVEMTGRALDKEMLEFIFENKTGALIEASMMIGAVLAGASEEELAGVHDAASCIGMAFQIADDILDVTGDEKNLGKPVHSDERNEKTTWVSLYGLDKAREDAEAYSLKAVRILKEMRPEKEGSFLEDLVIYLAGRDR